MWQVVWQFPYKEYVPFTDLSDAASELISLKEEDEDHLVHPLTLVRGEG